VALRAIDLDATCAFHLDNLDARVDLSGHELPNWARYPAGVAWSLEADGFHLRGFDGLLGSDVPIGAGLSSSAAVETCLATAWLALAGGDLPDLDLARSCRRAENEYVGVASGLMDQWASISGHAGQALLLDFTSLSAEPVPLPAACAIVIADSGERRTLGQSAYNQRVRECRQAELLLRERIPGLSGLGTLDSAEFADHESALPDRLRRRARHVVSEVERVRQAAEALRHGDPARFGELMSAGHASLRDDFEVSTPGLDLLVDLARQLPGCYGARLTGAGFGGCTVNWVEGEAAGKFAVDLVNAYESRSGRKSRAWVCRSADGAGIVSPPP
jgi:galactokinase